MALYKESPARAKAYLSKYSHDRAEEMLAAWRNLATYLIVKHNDMTVRPETSRGVFKMTKEGLPVRVTIQVSLSARCSGAELHLNPEGSSAKLYRGYNFCASRSGLL